MSKPPNIVPNNPPPLESYDDQGEYQRALDRRLNQAINPPPQQKYSGCQVVIIPVRLAISIGIDTTGEGQITHTLEIEIPANEFETLFAALNGRAVVTWIKTVRPVEVQTTMEEPNTPQRRKDDNPANNPNNWSD